MEPKIYIRTVFAVGIAVLLSLTAIDAPIIPAKAAAAVSIPLNVKFEEVASGLVNPLFITAAGDGSGRLFIVQRNGKILILKDGSLDETPFLDVGGIITTTGGEQGLLGLAFDPQYASNRRFYIAYTVAENNAVRLARYHASESDPDVADTSGTELLSINKSQRNHNGGMIAFGPDGYLYMAVGDGGGGGDPDNNGQNKNTLLGSILRLDVSEAGYSIPGSNPFHGEAGAQGEIWAYGLRNPWRFSFDRLSGDLYIGDVGQGLQEEINFQAAASAGGANYGWRVLEGTLCYNAKTCVKPSNYVPPVKTYNHGTDDSNGCSVTGGYVYRGTQFPALEGVYLYGDFCKGKVWGMVKTTSGAWTSALIADTPYFISTFGEDEEGEVYLADYATGKVLRLVEASTLDSTFLSAGKNDGFILESSETSGQGGTLNKTASTLNVGDDAANRQYRAVLSFNTSGLPDNAVVTKVLLKLKRRSVIGGGNPITTFKGFMVDIKKGSFGIASLQLADFQTKGNVTLGAFKPTLSSGWYTLNLTGGRAQVNKTGNTQIRLRFKLDDNNNNVANILKIYSGNAGATNRPQLIVEYFIP